MTALTGRIALVTGATHGVGRGVAFELAAAGATVDNLEQQENRARSFDYQTTR